MKSCLLSWIVLVSMVLLASGHRGHGKHYNRENRFCQERPSKNSPTVNEEIVEGNNNLGFELLRALGANKNHLISPLSIYFALGMTTAGARGSTRDGLVQALQLDSMDNSYHAAINNISRLLSSVGDYNISTANRIFLDRETELLEDFTEVIEEHYDGNIAKVNFKEEPEEARETINDWVSDETCNKINDLFPSGTITPDTKLVLANALYFKGTWDEVFDESKTAEREFDVSRTESVTVEMMKKKSDFKYFSDRRSLAVLEIPYRNHSLSMVILLPKDGPRFNKILSCIDHNKLTNLLGKMREREVDVVLPKFKIELDYSLGRPLSQLGMAEAFTGSADLSGFTGDNNLKVGEVRHKTFIEVNEEGTEAAAATGIQIRVMSFQPTIEFHATKPFLYMIRDNSSGSILFLGLMRNPAN